jgi:nicotinamidase/pyrazinamidase
VAQVLPRITLSARDALIVVDVQNGFVTGGGLPVPRGEEVVPVINRIATLFANVVLTQDWHPAGHASFAASHSGKKPFEVIELAYGSQVLWPEHCVQGSVDAALHADLDVPHAQLIVRKGFHVGVDSYSAFQEADRTTPTGLDGYLKQRGITRLFVAGLATDFCVAWSALDARSAGYETWVVEDATRAIDLDGSLDSAWREMAAQGVRRIQSGELFADQLE